MFSTLEMSIIAMIGTQEIIILALVILLLFGGKKIPELMKGLGKGVKSFKEGVNGIEDSLGDEKNDAKKESGKE
jgi:sec-independent protein translocase protein TatA